MRLMLFLLANAGGPGPTDNFLLERLLSQLAEGDTGALEQLYIQTKSAVYGFALSFLRDPRAAEDVMQDTYVRLYAAAPGYRPQGKPMAWILTVVRNLSLMWLRERKSRGGSDLEEEQPADPVDAIGASTDRLVLTAALESLPDLERQIVVLHSVSGLRHREIAELFGIPLSTALSRYHRALSKLRKLLKEEPV